MALMFDDFISFAFYVSTLCYVFKYTYIFPRTRDWRVHE